MADIHKAGLLVTHNGRILLCRKKHSTSLLILPGGKLEHAEAARETAEDCLRRECREELGDVEIANLRFVGDYASPAAGAEDKIVRIELFSGELRGAPEPHAEIEELVWFGPDDDVTLLAPSLRDVILLDLRRRGLFGALETPPTSFAK